MFRIDTREADPRWRSLPVSITAAVSVMGVVLWIVHRVWPALFLPWWFNTDEIVSYYEVIRQLRLDPSQTFFDIPGTPYITLTSLITAFWWAVARMTGFAAGTNPSDFAFVHIQGVITLMRGMTLTLYVASVALLFDIVRRCSGAIAAMLAALAFATLPVNVHYSSFARTESLGNVLSLGAIWIVSYSRWRSTPRGYGIAGLLGGAAVAARYHFALAALPVLVAIFFLRDRATPSDETEITRYRLFYRVFGVACTLAVAGALVTVLFMGHLLGDGNWLTNTMMLTTQGGVAQYAGAKLVIAKLWILLGLGAGVALLLYRFRKKLRGARLLIHPSVALLILGFVSGFVLSHPEFLWRGEYQLRSMQFYADWAEPNLTRMNALQAWWTVVNFYFSTALPFVARIAFFAGAAFILWKRQAIPLALLCGAVVFFFAHPLRMKMWEHHVLPWLPFLCFVPVAPAEWIAGFVASRLRHPFVPVGLTALASIAMILLATIRLPAVDDYFVTSLERTNQIVAMDRWVSEHVPSGSYRLESYYALGGDGFYRWIEDVGVPVPEFVERRRDFKIWWLDRKEVDGKTGYVCISPADISVFRPDLERTRPGSTLNPFEDSRFHPLQRFGSGPYRLEVFHFDFRQGGS